MTNGAPAGEPEDPYLRSLRPHIEALTSARSALADEPGAALAIRRLADVLAGADQHLGFGSIREAARLVALAEPAGLAEAADRLLDAMRGARQRSASRRQRVLLVDDDPDMTKLLTTILARPDRQIDVARSGAEVRTALQAGRIDLVVLDLGLPDFDGRQVLTSLRRNPETAATPVLVLSASGERWAEAECMALGAAGFVAKPFDPVQLGVRVNQLLTAAPAEVRTQPGLETAEPARKAGPVEVLLAESDPLTAMIIRQRLSREGWLVRHFASGTVALQAARTLVPSLVILDAMTTGIEGIELLSRLRALPEYTRIPILVLSDIGSEREVVRALGAGADDCIRKPFSPTELVARIERFLKRR